MKLGHIYRRLLMNRRLEDAKNHEGNDTMFVWTPDTELYARRTYPLRGKVNVTTIPESAYSCQHPRSAGACDAGWETAGTRWRIAQGLVAAMIHEDNIQEDEVRRVFMQLDEFAAFPFSTKPPGYYLHALFTV
jgi:hypothetical protein